MITALYKIGIISDKALTKSEFCRLIEKYCITKSGQRLKFRGLYNALSGAKGNEITAFETEIISPLIAAKEAHKVTDYKKGS